MKISIPLTGTRGDVQPAVALALELQGRGHDILVGAPPNLVDFVKSAGIEAVPCGPDVEKLYSSEKGQKALAAGSSFKLMPMVAQQMAEYAEQMDDEMIGVCEGADIVVSTLLTEDRAQSICEAMGIPLVTKHPFPARKNSLYTLPGGIPHSWNLPKPVVRGSWTLTEKMRGVAFGKYLKSLRRKLDLPPTKDSIETLLRRDGVPELQAYDSALLPGLAEEWGQQLPFVGFLTLPREARAKMGEQVDEDVMSWIKDGQAPVYVGFGSIPIRDTGPLLRMVEKVSARLGQRVPVNASWSDIDPNAQVGDHMKIVSNLAYDLVFPYCRAAVHHGGIGTTFESVRAKLPTLVCSISFDQPLWGAQVVRLGLGGHLPFSKINEERFEKELAAVLEPQVRERVEQFAPTLDEGTQGSARVADVVEARAAGA
ncbi:MAG: glycosyltransferase [Rhodococcus sp.]|nr:glycosyltransferase [Rhodococcus sp. (in: high G+C Gram-positive bacteria)]